MSGATIKSILSAMLYSALGGFAVLILVVVIYLENRPDLDLWHEAHLDAEFDTSSAVSDLEHYLALEDRLFRQLERRVLDRLASGGDAPINRFRRGSLTDPYRWDKNWNRTFELTTAQPVAGVLMLHGMSDSPYSLRALGTRLNEKGALVLGLRLPGHGTIPSGLVRLRWQDMAAAVRLAMRALRQKLGDKPLFIIGYSAGGALAVEYALAQMKHSDLPAVERIVLISPAIGVTRLAALSVWQARLGRLIGLDKLAWSGIQPEYNSYKYNSFSINAGVQVHRLAAYIQKRLDAARQSGRLKRFPPVLTFQSVVDATVSTPAVFTGLYQKLTNTGNELVLFDINRRAGVDSLLTRDPLVRIQALQKSIPEGSRLDLVTNENPLNRYVVAVRYKGGLPAARTVPLALQWPPGVHSLSHIALPFPEDDPLYGITGNSINPGVVLSKTLLRGERGVINIPADEILRLRWNPFYPYVRQRVETFLGL